MIDNHPLVSIITVNFNNTAVTVDMLRSLKKLTYDNFEVIVVDNGSVANPHQELTAVFPELKFIRSETNLGFAGGNNLGIARAMGDFLFMINNDTELTPGILQPLLETFRRYERVGAVSPKFHYYYAPGTIEYAGSTRINVLTGRNRSIGNKEKDTGQYATVSETYYAHGGGMMVPRSVVDEVGEMSEAYFLYYEELDWCERIRNHGFKIYFQPDALVLHKESATTGKESPFKTYYLTRNRLLFMRRNVKAYQFILFLTFLVMVTIPKNLFVYIFAGKINHMKAFFRGIVWNLKNGADGLRVNEVEKITVGVGGTGSLRKL